MSAGDGSEKIARLALRLDALCRDLADADRRRPNPTPQRSQWYTAGVRSAKTIPLQSTSSASDDSQKLRNLTLRIETLRHELAIAKLPPQTPPGNRQWWTGAGLSSSGVTTGDYSKRLSRVSAAVRAFRNGLTQGRPNRAAQQSWRTVTNDEKASPAVLVLVVLALSIIALSWVLLVDDTSWDHVLNLSVGR